MINIIHPALSKERNCIIDKGLCILDLKGIKLSEFPKAKKFIDLI